MKIRNISYYEYRFERSTFEIKHLKIEIVHEIAVTSLSFLIDEQKW